jgi:acetyl-CoA acetyltransferase
MKMEAYIDDSVRTPRGIGKSNGSLAVVSPVQLLTILLTASKERNNIIINDGRGFFTSRVFGKFINEGVTILA